MSHENPEVPDFRKDETPIVPGWDELNQRPSGAAINIDTHQMPADGVVEVHDTDEDILDGEKAAGGMDAESQG